MDTIYREISSYMPEQEICTFKIEEKKSRSVMIKAFPLKSV